MATAEERARVERLLRAYGHVSTTFQTLKADCAYFFDGDDACVAYVDTAGAWVAAGPPLSPVSRLGDVAAAFVAAARARGRRACFFGVEARLEQAAGGALRSIAIGDEATWDPKAWAGILAGHRSLREQLRRARAKGIVVRQVDDAGQRDALFVDAVGRLTDRWLATRGMAPMAFLVKTAPLALIGLHAFFAAERHGELVGFAVVLPVPARRGWLVETLVRDPRAPNGTAETLFDAVMRWAAARDAAWVTLGLAPLGGPVGSVFRLARRATKLLYDFEGLRAYKAKLRPTRWTPIYLTFPTSARGALALVDAIAAFTGDGFVRFGLRSLLRGPRAVLATLALLLWPWTLALALAPDARWFPAPWVKWSWVVFDAALGAALLRVLRRPALGLVTALAAAVSADAVVTLVHALAWNVRGAANAGDVAIVAIACAGPFAAAVTLWGARRRALVLAKRPAAA